VTTDPTVPAPERRFPTPLQAVIITISGFAMAFFGCLGALSTYSQSEKLFVVGMIVFIFGLLVCLGGVVLVLYLFVRAIVRSARANRTVPPGGPPLPPPPPPPSTPSSDAGAQALPPE
jgi:hypothetical protein